ncbi:MAG TPA: peptidoglycan-binding protein [Candidatus Caccovivens faecavium]|nr:peptidoglycan-binding protein [Candidatus Caccovivens faecavium]
MANEDFLIGANDEHGVNPPTSGKRTPVVPGLNRQIYENEFNRMAKNKFIEACMRQDFSVFDVKPELQDVSINERIRRINSQNLTLLVTFAYNAYGETFSSASGLEVFYSPQNIKANQSRNLAENLYAELIGGTSQNGRGVKTLDVGVLSNVSCVSSLIEAGFMTNLREARLMINPLFQTEVGEEACHGVCNYLGVSYLSRDNLNNYPLLRSGSQGNFVYLLQFILNEYGYNLTVDGIFGSRTLNAVRDFQRNNSLSIDGLVGTNTWRTLLTLPPYPLLREGYRGAYVTFLQQLLESNLYPVGGIDGIFGSRTLSAVRSFQGANNLTVDGLVGNNTWNALTNLNF